MSKKNIIIPPSLSWNEKQIKLYYQLAKKSDVVFAYYWTHSNNTPQFYNASSKWIASDCKTQKAARLPDNEAFSQKHACTKYALHATHIPSALSVFNGKLWVVAMCGKVIKVQDKKMIAQKRVIIGEVPKNEFNLRKKLVKDIDFTT